MRAGQGPFIESPNFDIVIKFDVGFTLTFSPTFFRRHVCAINRKRLVKY